MVLVGVGAQGTAVAGSFLESVAHVAPVAPLAALVALVTRELVVSISGIVL